jgi:hypothetical protein
MFKRISKLALPGRMLTFSRLHLAAWVWQRDPEPSQLQYSV